MEAVSNNIQPDRPIYVSSEEETLVSAADRCSTATSSSQISAEIDNEKLERVIVPEEEDVYSVFVFFTLNMECTRQRAKCLALLLLVGEFKVCLLFCFFLHVGSPFSTPSLTVPSFCHKRV